MNKMKKVVAVSTCLCMMLVVLAGCGAPKEKAFTSQSNIAVTATESWKQLTTKEELSELYMDAMTDADAQGVDLALKNGDNIFFTVETIDCSADLADLTTSAEGFKEVIAEIGEEAFTAQIKASSQLSDEETALYKALVAPDADFDLLYQQMSNVGWFETLATMKNYAFVGKEDVTLIGKSSSLSEYKYTNDDGVDLHFLEASVVLDGKLYTFNGWTEEKDFAKNKDAIKAMITTAKADAAK